MSLAAVDWDADLRAFVLKQSQRTRVSEHRQYVIIVSLHNAFYLRKLQIYFVLEI